MHKIIAILILFSIGNLVAQDNNGLVSSKVAFEIKNAVVKVDGKFTLKNTTVVWSNTNSDICKIKAMVDVATINTGIASRDKHLQGEEYFNAALFPTISLELLTIKNKTSNHFDGTFQLVMKGVKKIVNIPVDYTTTENELNLSGDFIINRLDYNVGNSSWVLSDFVKVKLSAVLKK
jgi:polyisoprenoid-binding protein YceI